MNLSNWINNIRWKYFTNQKAGLIFKEVIGEFNMIEKTCYKSKHLKNQSDGYANEFECKKTAKRFVMHETPNADTFSLDDTNNELLSILFQRKEDCENWLNLLNEYESKLQMCHEKALYWRNKAENIFGDMKTNVELQRENIQLKKELEKNK